MFNSQGGGYQPPAWQQGFNQAQQRNGPPPAKKPRTGPVITRYPPPPGYKGPAQPQVPYQHQAPAPYQQQPTWSHPAPAYNHGQQPYAGYQPQTYASPQSYSQPQYPSYPPQPQQFGYTPQPQYPGYAPQVQYPQTAYAPQTYHPQLVHSQSYPAPQPPTWQPPGPIPQSSPPQAWNAPNHAQPKSRHLSAPSLTAKSVSFGPLDGNGDPFPSEAAPGDDLESDFWDECHYARHPEDIDESLSLGMIEWKPALPTKRALPATFQEVELDALAPRKELPTDNESVSQYFIFAKRHEANLSVRQTEYWTEVKDDLPYRELPSTGSQTLTMSELLVKYRDRPDPLWSTDSYISATPEPAPRQIESEDDNEQSDFLGNLEQALQQNGTSHSRRHSRASSVTSISSQKITRPTPVIPVRDQAQEDLLAALGVTGSPKMVYQTPGPAIGAPQTEEWKAARTSRHNSVTGNSNLHSRPPPPPPPPGYPPHHRPASFNGRHAEGYNLDRRSSSGSHHTVVGSDFEDNDTTPRVKHNGRKRAHEDSDENSIPDDRRRQDDDETPKARRKLQRTDDPWSARRW